MNRQVPPLKQRMPCLNPIYPAGYDQLFNDIKIRIQKCDYSAQTNELIEKLLTHGETNYTCWVIKKRIYWAGNTTIQHQDQFSRQVLQENMKNFQLWDFRNFIYDETKNHESQYQLIDRILMQSPKNYHAWSNRTRLVGIVKNFSQQIKNTQKYLFRDPYNNSAWAYRAFCHEHLPVKDFQAEMQFALQAIKKYIGNEAAWNYLRGFFPCYKLRSIKSGSPKKDLLQYKDFPKIKQFCKQIIENKQIQQKLKIQTLLTLLIIDSHNQDTVQYSRQICSYLSLLEPLRANFYGWLKNSL